nr:unnamed protein product [Spirometra erinaceieuropaei]
MGSPLGPLLADVFMGKLERFQLSEQIDKLKHYGRYVDDIFAIATAETDVATLLDAANQAHPSIKFTLEMEAAGSLPFLDVLLSRRPDGSVQRSVYRKKTWSGQYTNFASFVPLQQKRNLVRCLAQRARKICSTDSIEEELRKIQDFLRENGYPERFIEKNIAELPIKPATPTAEKKTLFLKMFLVLEKKKKEEEEEGEEKEKKKKKEEEVEKEEEEGEKEKDEGLDLL